MHSPQTQRNGERVMSQIEIIVEILTIAVFAVGLLGTLWTAVRYWYRHNSRFLYFSACHLLPLTLRDDII